MIHRYRVKQNLTSLYWQVIYQLSSVGKSQTKRCFNDSSSRNCNCEHGQKTMRSFLWSLNTICQSEQNVVAPNVSSLEWKLRLQLNVGLKLFNEQYGTAKIGPCFRKKEVQCQNVYYVRGGRQNLQLDVKIQSLWFANIQFLTWVQKRVIVQANESFSLIVFWVCLKRRSQSKANPR